MSGTPIYDVWRDIIKRTTLKTNSEYKNYGGRGIKCEWNSFEEFYKDMGDIPEGRYSIDRIDNNGNYSKENCRWATTKEQGNNRRTNHLLTYGGETMNTSLWAERVGIKRSTIQNRIRRGWNIKDALTKQPQKRGC